jgi:mitochondrial fission protein ELM1
LDFAKSGAGLMITPSRRTPPALIARIKRDIQGTDFFLWDGAPVAGLDNPYFGMLGLADHAAVTADSVNMATEAAIAGKPVHVIALDKKPLSSAAKFERFHAELAERGVSRPLTSPLQTWTYAPLDETSRAAAEVIRRAGFSPPSSAPKAG